MPTTASSNNPHVRITPDAHQRIRSLSRETGFSQGDLVDIMTTLWLVVLRNPELLPPRQRRSVPAAAAPVPSKTAPRKPPLAAVPKPQPEPAKRGRK